MNFFDNHNSLTWNYKYFNVISFDDTVRLCPKNSNLILFENSVDPDQLATIVFQSCIKMLITGMLKDGVYSKSCLKRPLKRRPKLVFKTYYRLMQVKSIATCLSLRPSFCLFLSGGLKTEFTAVYKIFSMTMVKRFLVTNTKELMLNLRLE